MKALTLTQPWCGLVASGIKRIENRPRVLIRPENLRKPFALHASRELVRKIYTRIYEIAPELRPELATTKEQSRWHELSRITSAVIGVATIDDMVTTKGDPTAIAELLGDQLRWFFGPIGYLLRDVRALATPVPCSGGRGFWTLPLAVERAVMAQLGGDRG
jgi:hypothetical protein